MLGNNKELGTLGVGVELSVSRDLGLGILGRTTRIVSSKSCSRIFFLQPQVVATTATSKADEDQGDAMKNHDDYLTEAFLPHLALNQ